jgi:MoaA/NifB/PqqE/SkfB family radical SAM enzyme
MFDVDALVGDSKRLEPFLHAVETGGPPPFLRSAKIKVTARCNLRCAMCRFGRGWAPPELSEERFVGVLDELRGLGCEKVHFSGGEVFVRPDFLRLVTHARGLGLRVTLTSNLTLVDKARAKALMRSGLASISTSLDGAGARTHDRVRGIAGSFKRTVRALGHLAEERARRGAKTRLRVNFTLLATNFREYPEVIALAAQAGAVDVTPMPVDDNPGESSHRLSRSQIESFNAEVAPRVLEARLAAGMPVDERLVYPFGRSDEAVRQASLGRYAGDYYERHLCFAPYSHVFVAWNGEVFLCCMTDGRIEPLGDLSQGSVRDVFHGERFAALRRRMRRARLAECHRCDMFLEENRTLEGARRRLAVVA